LSNFSVFAGPGRLSAAHKSPPGYSPLGALGRHYDQNQPRVPAGHPDGGQWTSGSEGPDESTAERPRNGIEGRMLRRGERPDVRLAQMTPGYPRPGFAPIPPVFVPGTPENREWAEQAIKGGQALIDHALAGLRTFRPKNDCEQQAQSDEAICRSLPRRDMRERCWASANERFGACVKGKPLPPLITW
jgi:hypothetical protein